MQQAYINICHVVDSFFSHALGDLTLIRQQICCAFSPTYPQPHLSIVHTDVLHLPQDLISQCTILLIFKIECRYAPWPVDLLTPNLIRPWTR